MTLSVDALASQIGLVQVDSDTWRSDDGVSWVVGGVRCGGEAWRRDPDGGWGSQWITGFPTAYGALADLATAVWGGPWPETRLAVCPETHTTYRVAFLRGWFDVWTLNCVHCGGEHYETRYSTLPDPRKVGAS